jgi:hypothetical protein
MKKLFVITSVLYFASVYASAAPPGGPLYTPPTNAYWHIIADGGDNALACVLQGQTVYGDGDDCRIRNDVAFDFTTAVSITVEFDVKLTTASPADHCLFQIRDTGDSGWTLIEDFNANTSGYEHRSYDLTSSWSGKGEVYVRFRWVSDGSGTSDGIRIDDFSLEYGVLGDYTKNTVFEWTTDHPISHESHSCTSFLSTGDSFYFEWNYDTNGQTLLWYWRVDNVHVFDPDGDLLPTEHFDTWLPAGWSQNQHGENGKWEQFNPSPSGNPPCAACNSVGHPTWTYDASLYSPEMVCDNPNVTAEFWSDYNNYSGIDTASFNIWVATTELNEFSDDFEGDLSRWVVRDFGSGNANVGTSSLGKIKAGFK